jgi:putative nucleotidyltransferase with HDIG domain
VVKAGLRAGDCVGRWGGEEFVAILPDTEPLEALNLAEGLRKRIGQHALAGNGEIKVTSSLGVASYPQDATGREELLLQADGAMYAAKRLGRNQTRSAHEPLVKMLENTESEHKAAAQVESQAMIEALLASLATRDPDTVQHMHRVSALALKLALALGLNSDEAHLVSVGGLLHDIGKLAIPDAILGKPGKLEEHERSSILQHPVFGATILQSIHSLQAAAPIVRAHHEQINGLGYPDGLHGDEIPLAARIVAVADVYDAMTSERSYHASKSSSEALHVLRKGAGTHFDPRVVETLTSLLTTSSGLSSTV